MKAWLTSFGLKICCVWCVIKQKSRLFMFANIYNRHTVFLPYLLPYTYIHTTLLVMSLCNHPSQCTIPSFIKANDLTVSWYNNSLTISRGTRIEVHTKHSKRASESNTFLSNTWVVLSVQEPWLKWRNANWPWPLEEIELTSVIKHFQLWTVILHSHCFYINQTFYSLFVKHATHTIHSIPHHSCSM